MKTQKTKMKSAYSLMSCLKGRIALAALALCMLCLPMNVKAETVANIQCGDNVYATLNDMGTLTISGTGDMWDCYGSTSSPFWSYGDEIYQIVIKEGVTSVGNHMFDSYYWRYSSYGSKSIVRYNNIVKITLPNSLKTIGEYAFYKMPVRIDLNVPSGVQKIETYAFGSSNINCKLNYGLLEIGDYAFQSTSYMKSVTLPSSLQSIGVGAFLYSGLSAVTIPSSVVIIKANAFESVKATIKSSDIVLAPTAFGYGSTIVADRGSAADKYAKAYGRAIEYFQYQSTITFNANGGKVSTKSRKVWSETLYGNLPKPTRKGYTFDGWYTKKSGGKKITHE